MSDPTDPPIETSILSRDGEKKINIYIPNSMSRFSQRTVPPNGTFVGLNACLEYKAVRLQPFSRAAVPISSLILMEKGLSFGVYIKREKKRESTETSHLSLLNAKPQSARESGMRFRRY